MLEGLISLLPWFGMRGLSWRVERACRVEEGV
jgi:hypothetical protein